MKILIQNGRLIDPASQTDRVVNLAIAAGRIIGIGKVPACWKAKWRQPWPAA
jgi:dihydroorotase